MDEEQPQAQTTSAGHEPIDTSVRAVWITGAVLAGVVIASFLLVAGLMQWFTVSDGEAPAGKMGEPVRILSDPRQLAQLRELRTQEHGMLSEYRWVDRAAGVARIPIERAIQIVGQEGFAEAHPEGNQP
jgi:hypothetical protein